MSFCLMQGRNASRRNHGRQLHLASYTSAAKAAVAADLAELKAKGNGAELRVSTVHLQKLLGATQAAMTHQHLSHCS